MSCLGTGEVFPPYSQYIEFTSLGKSLKTDELVISWLASTYADVDTSHHLYSSYSVVS